MRKLKNVANLSPTAIVKAVHDGDSFKLLFDDGTIKWVRLYACDAPEVISNYVSKNQPFGKEAGLFMRNLLKGNRIAVEFLFEDKFKRPVVKLTFEDHDLTEYAIEKGLAWFYNDPKLTSAERTMFKGLQGLATFKKVGLWSETGRKLRPDTWRARYPQFPKAGFQLGTDEYQWFESEEQ